MESFATIAKAFQPLTIFENTFLDVCGDLGYVFVTCTWIYLLEAIMSLLCQGNKCASMCKCVISKENIDPIAPLTFHAGTFQSNFYCTKYKVCLKDFLKKSEQSHNYVRIFTNKIFKQTLTFYDVFYSNHALLNLTL